MNRSCIKFEGFIYFGGKSCGGGMEKCLKAIEGNLQCLEKERKERGWIRKEK